MLRSVLTLMTLILVSLSTHADNTAVEGYWADNGSILYVVRNGDTLSARLHAFSTPQYLPNENGGIAGQPRLDDNNPDPALRDRPLLDMELLSQYSYDGKRWNGKIYDPESGNTYSSRMHVDAQGRLQMRGYIGLPMFGRTARFEPLSKCTPAMQWLLHRSAKPAIGACEPTQPED